MSTMSNANFIVNFVLKKYYINNQIKFSYSIY